jgi:hypothetical protein
MTEFKVLCRLRNRLFNIIKFEFKGNYLDG